MTLREVADEMHISTTEVLRIERQALKKLRKSPEARMLCLLMARFEMEHQPEEM